MDDFALITAVLPAVSLAMMADAAHMIAADLLAAYLGEDGGQRAHASVTCAKQKAFTHYVFDFPDAGPFRWRSEPAH